MLANEEGSNAIMKEAATIMQTYYSSPEGALRMSRIDSYVISSKKNAQWNQKIEDNYGTLETAAAGFHCPLFP